MKNITPGHMYYLANFEGPGHQILQFIQKEEVEGILVTINNGTTNEEVLEVLIDRLKFLNEKAHSVENDNAIENLVAALAELNRRTEGRKAREVEGTPAK